MATEASLLVIQGADQGKRFGLNRRPMALGRDNSNPIRLHDHEVSRRHAEIRPQDDGLYALADLGSANGTYVNGELVDQVVLKLGDQVQIGQSILVYEIKSDLPHRDQSARVELSETDRSAILKSIPADESSRILHAPGSAGDWLRSKLSSFTAMYQASQAIRLTTDVETLLPEILDLVFESIGADRGAILLVTEETNELVAKAVKWRDGDPPDLNESLPIPRSIVDHVLQKGEGVITSDAPADKRFASGGSIAARNIREAICVPLRGRQAPLGVLYADIRSAPDLDAGAYVRGKFTNDHLMLMAAIGHQAGLAIENTRLYEAKLQSERLAAVGQTIATLSHHIKNILQGIRGGSYLIDMGLNEKDDVIVRRGWGIVEKNQNKIYHLVMDMLSFSKDREPALEWSDLNATTEEVIELMQSRATELGVALTWTPATGLPPVLFDPDGLHRAILNIVTNAIDAAEEIQGAKVMVSTSWDSSDNVARVLISDNGVGIAEDDLAGIFGLFASTKGTRGTGLGLPVSQKIVREHGGKIVVTSRIGEGSTFTIELPLTSSSTLDTGEMTLLED